MSKREDMELLCDIQEAVKRIEAYVENAEYKGFLADKKTQDAVIRNLEIIGEAAKNISVELKKKYADVEWKKLAGLRDKIIHFCFGVNWDIVWDVVKNRIPKLKKQIEAMIRELTGLG